MPRIARFIEKQWEGDELRRDRKQYVTEAIRNDTNSPSQIGHTESRTIGWSIEASPSLTAALAGLSLSAGFNESRTFTNEYRFQIEPGRTARVIYIPKMHHINGWIQITEGGDIIPNPTGSSVPTKVEIVVEREWCAAYYPIDGGQYELEYEEDYCTAYEDSNYQGQYVMLPRGRYDWGSIPNDKISSLRVPAGMKVTLYENTHFQGRSKIFTGDVNYVGDDFNDIASSAIVE